VNALTMVSALIFLYGANTRLACIAIVHEAGATAAAMAVATLLFAMGLGVKAAYLFLDRFVLQRFTACGDAQAELKQIKLGNPKDPSPLSASLPAQYS
jgi:hypothetical protein